MTSVTRKREKSDLTDKELDRLEALCEDCAPPWKLIPSTETITGTIVLHDGNGIAIADLTTQGEPTAPDELIAMAPTLIRDLIGEVRHLRGAIRDLVVQASHSNRPPTEHPDRRPGDVLWCNLLYCKVEIVRWNDWIDAWEVKNPNGETRLLTEGDLTMSKEQAEEVRTTLKRGRRDG